MATFRRAASLAVLALALLPGRAIGADETPHPQDQIVLSGSVMVPRGKEAGEIVVFHGSVTVSGVARGDVVVLDGRIVVTGQVSGSVVNLGGPVVLGPGAQVLGRVMATGDVLVREGAQVGGGISEGVRFTLREPLSVLGRFVGWLAVSLSTLVLAFVLLLLAPRGVDAVHGAATSGWLPSAAWGLGAFLGLPTLGVLLLVTVLGVPLGLSLLLAFAFALFVGYAMSAWVLGRLLWPPPRGRVLALLFGWAILTAIGLIPYVGGLLWAIGGAFGLGAIVVATWRARGHRGRHRPGPPPVAPLVTEEPMEEEGVGL